MQVVCDVAGGVNVAQASSAALVYEHPIGLRDWLPRERRYLGLDPDPDDGEVARHAAVIGGHRRLHTLAPLEPDDLILAAQLDAVGGVDRGERCADLFPQHVLQRRPPRKYRSHTNPELRQGSSHLAADAPHPDHHRSPIFSRLALDRVALADRAELMDPRQLRARNL